MVPDVRPHALEIAALTVRELDEVVREMALVGKESLIGSAGTIGAPVPVPVFQHHGQKSVGNGRSKCSQKSVRNSDQGPTNPLLFLSIFTKFGARRFVL